MSVDVRVEDEDVKAEQSKVRKNSESGAGSKPWERRSSRTLRHARGSVRSVRSTRADGEGRDSLQPRRDSDNESTYSFRAECGLDQIALLSETESDLEFFDAKGKDLWRESILHGCPPRLRVYD